MTTRWLTITLTVTMLLAALLCGGCSDDGDTECTCTLVMPDEEPEIVTTSGLMGPGGGLLILDGEYSLGFPAGALEAETQVTITRDPEATFSLVDYRRPVSPIYTATPQGMVTQADLQATVHFDPMSLPTEYPNALRLYANIGQGWEELDTRLNLELGVAQARLGSVADIVLTEPNPGEGVYAEYGTVLFFTSEPGGAMRRFDQVFARFDVACADLPQQELEAGEVYGYGPGWSEQLFDTGRSYTYQESAAFLGLGDAFYLNANGSDTVPSVEMQGEVAGLEVVVTAPTYYESVSLDGFTVTWDGSEAGGEVRLAVEQSGVDLASITVANTGSYTFTANQLAGNRPGNALVMVVWQHETPLYALGFDPRSRCLQVCANYVDVNLVE